MAHNIARNWRQRSTTGDEKCTAAAGGGASGASRACGGGLFVSQRGSGSGAPSSSVASNVLYPDVRGKSGHFSWFCCAGRRRSHAAGRWAAPQPQHLNFEYRFVLLLSVVLPAITYTRFSLPCAALMHSCCNQTTLAARGMRRPGARTLGRAGRVGPSGWGVS